MSRILSIRTKEIELTNPKLILKNVNYNHVRCRMDSEGHCDITEKEQEIRSITKDNYEFIETDETTIKLDFKRSRYFDPPHFYRLEIVFEVSWEYEILLNKDLTLEGKQELLHKVLSEKEHISDALYPASSKASLVISNLTFYEEDPLIAITPPFLLFEEY